MQAKQEKEFICYLLLVDRCSATSRQAGHIIHHGFSGTQMPSLQSSSCFLLYPYFTVQHYVLCQNILLAILAQLSWLHPFQVPKVQPTFSLAGLHKKIKSFWLCKHCSVTTGTPVSYHNYFHQKCKAQHFMSFYEESWFHLSQNFDSGWYWKNLPMESADL